MNHYWQKRQEAKYIAGERTVKEYYKGLQEAFEKSRREIGRIVNDFYVRYGIANDLNNFAKIKQKLNKIELGDLEDFIALAKATMGKYDLALTNMSIKAQVTRYEALAKQVDSILQQLYAINYEHDGAQMLGDVFNDAYYRTWYNIDQYKGFHAEFAQVNPRNISELISYPYNGASFSERLWKQKDYLLEQLKESITRSMIQGVNPEVLAKDFAKKFKSREYEAERLLHTETSFILEQASQTVYRADGVERYQWDATLDIRTCEKCGELDGQIFDVREAIAGVNMPPLHSFCRCTTVPYYGDEDNEGETRVARDEKTGKTYKVPSDMTYKEWKEKYVDNSRENVIMKAAKENGIRGVIDVHPRPIDLTNYEFDDKHINKQRKHNVTKIEAEQFMKEADVVITRWNGQFKDYLGENGAVYIDIKTKIIKTAFKATEYDEGTRKFMEVVKSAGK